MLEDEYQQMIGSSRTYSKIAGLIFREYGVPSQRYSHRSRSDALMAQIAAVVREECRRAAEEAAFRVLKVASQYLPPFPEEGLYVPASEVRIDSGHVGTIRVRAFNVHRAGSPASDGLPSVA